MHNSRLSVIVALAATLTIFNTLDAAPVAKAPAAKARKAKSGASPLARVQDVPGLPRVMLIGDSISIGYTVPVRQLLKGKANVHRPAANCGPSQRGVENLDAWLGTNHWNVIHFNFGLHDLKFVDEKGANTEPPKGKPQAAPALYETNLRAIVARLKATGARLVWCTTTPVPEASTARIKDAELEYNRIAAKIMKENGIATDDLHAFILPRQSEIQLPHNVHFTSAGYEALARQVADAIEAQLK